VLGIVVFKESIDWTRLLFLSLIITGIVGLKIRS
jgi:multidrug transporter EmrE-like cation transporter